MTDDTADSAKQVSCEHCGQPAQSPARVSILAPAGGADRELIACGNHAAAAAFGPQLAAAIGGARPPAAVRVAACAWCPPGAEPEGALTMVGWVEQASGPGWAHWACEGCSRRNLLLPLAEHPEDSDGSPRRRPG